MKVMSVKNVEGFLKTVNECSGDVFLETEEGDSLNLKSKLTQYVMLSKVFGGEADLGALVIKADKEDTVKIAEYLMRE